MKRHFEREKIVIFSGSGISASSGISTFRGANGLWKSYRLEELVSIQAWQTHPEVVLEFYNERRAKAAAAEPNAGHRAIVDLERNFEVIVVTQNVDDFHERAGSSRVIHLHGELRKARSTADPALLYDLGAAPIRWGDQCDAGAQLRPHIVWFGEEVMRLADARFHIETADRLVVVGTSLVVYPAAGLIHFAPPRAQKIIVDVDIPENSSGFEGLVGSADLVLPGLVQRWLEEKR